MASSPAATDMLLHEIAAPSTNPATISDNAKAPTETPADSPSCQAVATFDTAKKPSKGRLIDLLDPDRYIPMLDKITEYLDPADLVNLRRVSRKLGEVYTKVQQTQWNINTALKKFVRDPVEFRNKLGEVSGIISGMFALDFLDRRATGDRLDIFVRDVNQEVVVDWFLHNEDYVYADTLDKDGVWQDYHASSFVEERRPEWENRDGIREEYILFRLTRLEATKLRVYVHASLDIPRSCFLATNGTQHSLALANFITATKVYSPFARGTFLEYRSYTHGVVGEDAAYALNAVASTGRKTVGIRLQDSRMKTTLRKFADGETWSMILDSTGVRAPETPDYVVDATAFLVGASHMLMWFYETTTTEICHVGTNYVWLYPYPDQIVPHLDTAVALELYKTPRESFAHWVDIRPTLAQLVEQRHHRNHHSFPHKTFYDDMMPQWIKEIEDDMAAEENGSQDYPRKRPRLH
ncbi:hypothetical protein BU16DRAFT_587192 [Lophium mytilinum]|uniref:F-box domain-containing protein n=1 Tax=Lophium mytilinum TaxID=390894 RepID=A0A6A6RB99_9PEZI|nr:hypothetical protein BU16DRAFT_587192 [Lophium mytilinum]